MTEDIQQTKLFRIIVGALRSTIDAHGPIDRNSIGSAAKRVTAAVRGAERGEQ